MQRKCLIDYTHQYMFITNTFLRKERKRITAICRHSLFNSNRMLCIKININLLIIIANVCRTHINMENKKKIMFSCISVWLQIWWRPQTDLCIFFCVTIGKALYVFFTKVFQKQASETEGINYLKLEENSKDYRFKFHIIYGYSILEVHFKCASRYSSNILLSGKLNGLWINQN